MSEVHSFVVTSVDGHIDVTGFTDPGPRFVEVMVTATNGLGEEVTFRRPLDNQPHIGDVIEFNEMPSGNRFQPGGPAPSGGPAVVPAGEYKPLAP